MDKLVRAKTKYVRISPRKARLVADMIRGMDAVYAAEVLKYTNKKAALPIRKTVESAIANAENNFDMNKNDLVIVEARIDEAPTFKRGLPVARGRYHRILKRNSHIVIGLGNTSTVAATKETSLEESIKEEKPKAEKIEKTKKEETKKSVKPESKTDKSSNSEKKLKKEAKKEDKK